MGVRDYLGGIAAAVRGRRPGRPAHEPARASTAYATMWTMLNRAVGTTGNKPVLFKPTPRNLRYFTRAPVMRRAINAIKNPVGLLDWDIVPDEGVDWDDELHRQALAVTVCLNQPNHGDSWTSFIHQIIEDWCLGAGVAEMQLGGDPERPIWLWPVDALSVQIYPFWDGNNPNEVRYQQTLGYGNLAPAADRTIKFRNDEILYIKPNPSSSTPYGLGPAEIAFDDMARILGVADFSGKVASNARPSILLDMGDGIGPDELTAFRSYFINEVEGQGITPITALTEQTASGKTRGPTAIRLYPEGDEALYLKYQEFQRGVVALAFDISPQNMNLERDVNRNTGEVAEDRDWDQAIKPLARQISASLTRDMIKAKLGFTKLRHRFKGLDREDERATAEIFKIYYQLNCYTPNQILAKIGEPANDSPWGDLYNADVEIAQLAARGAGQIDDPGLPKSKTPSLPKPGPSRSRSVTDTKARVKRPPMRNS